MIVSVSLALLFLRLLVSLWGYLRLLTDPTAEPVGVPELIDVEEQALRDAETVGVDIDRRARRRREALSHGAVQGHHRAHRLRSP